MNYITDNLYVGDEVDATQEPMDHIDRVVTMCQGSNHMTTDHFPIDDGEHPYPVFREAADTVLECLENNETVMVHCNAGISRAPSVAAAALAAYRGVDYGTALSTVRSSRPIVDPCDDLVYSLSKYSTQKMVEPYL